MMYEYYINLDERGEFYADVRRQSDDVTVYEIHGYDIFEDGFMRHKQDLDGMRSYLIDLSIIPIDSDIVKAN